MTQINAQAMIIGLGARTRETRGGEIHGDGVVVTYCFIDREIRGDGVVVTYCFVDKV